MMGRVALDAAVLRPGAIVAGKYRLDRLLGRGGMAGVFAATHRLTQRRFAIKFLLPEVAGDPDVARRFLREAKIAGRFEHPNAVRVYDVIAEQQSFYMVMELLEGETLAQRLARVGRLSPREASRILVPCMRAVAQAHGAGIVHRDLKPANVFLCRASAASPERPKVLDFGIARISEPGLGFDSAITKIGSVIGTPSYMSPEQARGLPVDRRTDVYAFGVMLYQALSGRLPHAGDDLRNWFKRAEPLTPIHRLLPDLEPALAQIVERAMAPDRARRFPDLEAMASAFEAHATCDRLGRSAGEPANLQRSHGDVPAVASLQPVAIDPHATVPGSRPLRRTHFAWWVLGCGLAFVVAAVIADLLLFRSGPAADTVTTTQLPSREAPAAHSRATPSAPQRPAASPKAPDVDPRAEPAAAETRIEPRTKPGSGREPGRRRVPAAVSSYSRSTPHLGTTVKVSTPRKVSTAPRAGEASKAGTARRHLPRARKVTRQAELQWDN